MQHFFTAPENIQDKIICITGDDVNHIKNVLRMKVGEEISVSNGIDGKDYRCHISSFEDDRVVCELRFIKESGVELPVSITLFQCLPKGDKMETIIQKCVELGVSEIVPVASKRCVMKLDPKKEKSRIARWQGISEAAAKQSMRGIVPEVRNVMSFKEAVNYAEGFELKAIPYELAEGMTDTKKWIDKIKESVKSENADKPRAAVFIGPEGGFDETEVALCSENGIVPISLGKRILRTETAGMTVMSIIMYELEIMSENNN